MKHNYLAVSSLPVTLLSLLALFSLPVSAETGIAVLDFELKDLTPMPRTPAELERTASVAPLLREALAEDGGYEMVMIDPEAQGEAGLAVGYLFDPPALAAELGRQFGPDWTALRRLHKPSYLFAYLKVLLVNVETQ